MVASKAARTPFPLRVLPSREGLRLALSQRFSERDATAPFRGLPTAEGGGVRADAIIQRHAARRSAPTPPRSHAPLLKLALLLAALALATPAQAQFAAVRGAVVGEASGQPLPGASVQLAALDTGETRGQAASADGTFAFERLLPGEYVVAASFVGFESQSDTLTLRFGAAEEITLRLAEDPEALGDVVVEEERVDRSADAAGLRVVRPQDLARVPMPGVSPDLAAYLTTQPGFVQTGDRGGQLFVRGGTPTQNLVLVDGIPLYQPFHIVGFYSALPADLVAYADVYAGGFGPRYGGRISSVIDVQTVSGSKQRVTGSVALAPFLAGVTATVPVLPGEVSLVVSARESLVDRVAPELLGEALPFRFGDRFAKLHAFLSQTSTFTATYLQSYDEGSLARDASDGSRGPASTWRSQAAGARYQYLPPEAPVLAEFGFHLSELKSTYASSATQAPRSSDVQSFGMTLDFTYLLGAARVHVGGHAITHSFAYDLRGGGAVTKEAATEGAAFVDTRFTLSPKLSVAGGVRAQGLSSNSELLLAPRLRLAYRPEGPTGAQTFSLATGIYHQQLVGLTNAQDVADVFVAWTAVPRESRVPEAQHVIAGWTRRWLPWLETSAEGYAKRIRTLSFARYQPRLDRFPEVDLVDGETQGVDLRVTAERPRFYGYIGYGWSRVRYMWQDRQLGDPDDFAPPHDRTHQLDVLAQAMRGPYRLSLRWQYGSGLPFTQLGGFYDALPQSTPSAPTQRDPDAARTPTASRSLLYAARLPAYHRLDVSLQRLVVREHFRVRYQLGLINAYDRPNVFTVDLRTGARTNQLPLIPTVGIYVEVR